MIVARFHFIMGWQTDASTWFDKLTIRAQHKERKPEDAISLDFTDATVIFYWYKSSYS